MGKTFSVAFGVCLVCALLVSTAAVSLRPRQDANRALDRKQNILLAAGLQAEGKRIDEIYAQRILPRVVELATGEHMEGIDPEKYDPRRMARDPEASQSVPPEDDLASIRRRANYAVVYLVEDEGRVAKLILPVHGLGLWSTLYGFLTLDYGDLTTIRNLVFYEHGETPGLGGEVDNPDWRAQWDGKQVYDEYGAVRLEVIKGQVNPQRPEARHQVDGLSGATLTSQGVDRMLKYWLGQHGFGPYLAKLKRQGV